MASDKLKEAVHYVIAACNNPARLGAVRLNKILWFADCEAYRSTGMSITGERYIKRQFGPVPSKILEAIRDLENESKIAVKDTPHYNKTMRQFFSTQDVVPTSLSDKDISVLHSYTEVICENYTAVEISNISHDQVWDAAAIGEEIPLYAIFAAVPGEISPEVIAWADSRLAAA